MIGNFRHLGFLYATCTSPIMHLICSPIFGTTFVFHFAWVLQPSQEKLKTVLMQNFGGQMRCIVGNMRVANSVKKATMGRGYSKLIFKKIFLSYTIYFGDNDFLKVLGNTSCFSWKCHLQKVYKLKTLKSCMDISF